MNEDTKALLRKLVAEWTEDGEDMGGLPRAKADAEYRLRETKRYSEADLLARDSGFFLSGTDDGLVWIHIGGKREVLIDFKGERSPG